MVPPVEQASRPVDFGHAIALINFVDTAGCRDFAVPPIEEERRIGT
jgi:hypothetical protein